MNNNDISGEIIIPSQNKMSVKYRVIGQDVSDAFSEIDIMVGKSSDVLAEISPRVESYDDKPAEINIVHGGNSDVSAEIQPIGGDNVLAELIVFPGNVMSAIYEVKEPPRITTVLNPIKDALIRSVSPYDTINYGKNNSLSVGKYQNEVYRSYIEFDTSIWSTHIVTTNSKLRLYYAGELPLNSELELLTVGGNWSELGITYRNSPSPLELISTTFTINKSKKYIEFDFTDVTSTWIKKTIVNNGFVIRAANEDASELISFRSKESTQPPQLIVTYFDSRVYSAGRSQITSEIIVAIGQQSDVFSEVEVSSSIGNRDKFAEIYVHRYEDPVDRDVLADIIVTREAVETEITVTAYGDDEVSAEISVMSLPQFDPIEAEITVSKVEYEAEVFVKYSNDINAEIVVQRREDSDILTEVSVTREQLDAEIDVKYSDDTLAEITIEAFRDEDILSEVSVSREIVYAEVYVSNNSDVLSEIIVTRRIDDDIETELTVSREYVYAEISVKGLAESDVETEVIVRVQDDSDRLSEVIVTREQTLAEITVVETSNIDAEIYVKHNDDITTEVNVHVHDSVLAEIDVVKVSEILAEISVTRTSLDAEIMVPYYGDSDVLSEVTARVLGVSDAFAEIQIGNPVPVGDSYAFII